MFLLKVTGKKRGSGNALLNNFPGTDYRKGKTMKRLVLAFLFTGTCLSQTAKPKFLDKPTKINLAITAASFSLDALSSRQINNRGGGELNPIARPFVHSNAGTAVYFGAGFAATAGTTYLVRNHPRLKRWIPRVVSSLEFGCYAWNRVQLQKFNQR